MFRNKARFALNLFLVAVVAMPATNAEARPNIGQPGKKPGALKTTATGCDPAVASIDLDINNVRAKLMTGGDMWWDIGIGEAKYEIPKGTKRNSLFAGSVWIGGFTTDKNLKVAAQTYRQDGNDYWPGPLNPTNEGAFSIDKATCSDWDRFWKVDRLTINKFRELVKGGGDPTSSSDYDAILQWPARNNPNVIGTSGGYLTLEADREYAPFIDVDADGTYNPNNGINSDYPDILGDQFVWWVFNDKGNTKQQTKTEAIGMEVQASAFAFSTKDYLNDATFYNYKLLNRSLTQLDSTYIATWTDADLGYYKDDYIGCDTVRGLGILYNGLPQDGNGEVNSYGSNVPMVGIDFFKGPKKTYAGKTGDSIVTLKMEAFTYYNNNSDARIGNPDNGIQIYNYMTGSGRNGQRFVNDYQGPNIPSTALGQGPTTKFVFFGNPEKAEWSECNCKNPADDRRFIHSSGPFSLKPGAVNDITIGAVWVPDAGGCPNTSFKKIRAADDLAQDLFDNAFKTIEGPEAPRLEKVELDKKIVFYVLNDAFSTNYKELYGRSDSAKYRVPSPKARRAGLADSLYKFEGYRVFQLKSGEIQPSQIFDERGEVNEALAKEVFQTDIKNGVGQVVNYNKRIDIVGADNIYDAVVKVNGADMGLVHSFEVTNDAFATGLNKGLVNYKTYYFVAIAYAYNNFANFDPTNIEETQDVAYLESTHGPGGSVISVVAAMPNPSNGNMGTELGVGFGAGVVIKRLEGTGNGGNEVEMTDSSEALALQNSFVAQPSYKPGFGPVKIKVVNPLQVVPADWELYIEKDPAKPGNINLDNFAADISRGLDSSKLRWRLVKTNNGASEIIYSENNLDILNEQILEKYGFSVAVQQVARPGDNKENGNGYISSKVEFADSSRAWLGGVIDQEGRSLLNWVRSGSTDDPDPLDPSLPYQECLFADVTYDPNQFYEKLLSNNSYTTSTWAPYSLGAVQDGVSGLACGFGITKAGSARDLFDLHSVDVVFTSDKSKWSKCIVLEISDDKDLAEGKAEKFKLRRHRSWTGDVDASGTPIYSSNVADTSFSYFPGYAINQETGERLNIFFAEDSYLGNHNGRDMIWNPTSTILDGFGNPIFGGKHYVYVSKIRYDGCDSIVKLMYNISPIRQMQAYQSIIWTGKPVLAPFYQLETIGNGLIPTETRLKFRVNRPYNRYFTTDTTAANSSKGYPRYSFSTSDLAPKTLGESGNTNENQALLDRIHAVPNPYYAFNGYEKNRLDTRVKIINLPAKATISVYSLDGSLIRRIDKDNDLPYVDWDIRNAKGLPIASGMYLIHVKTDYGESIIKWFGAMRPVDVTQY